MKTALSIQNMGFMRGLSPAYMGADPGDQRLGGRASSTADPTLRGCGFTVLRERAAIGYTGDAFHGLRAQPRRDVAVPEDARRAVAREPDAAARPTGERLATMASLLHRDADGRSLVGRADRGRRALDPASWLRSYLHAYVRPIVHCLLAHDLAFMPHGENLVLVLRDRVPVRALMKDIGEEVAVMSTDAAAARRRWSGSGSTSTDDIKALSLHTDVFDGFLRHLAAILDEDGVLDGGDVLGRGRRCVAPARRRAPRAGGRGRDVRPVPAGVPAQLPEPAAAAQHPGDGRPRRPGRVADLRRHPGQPDRGAGAGRAAS